ncbi:hypothetical protein A3F66_04990 [candidate division TM6 bacterium RIFCSPHIGHO2_12_FULL_32_22]|nr:MAG: hypothetical protein A3F66_04990 [candidate division TM6 bacterium RIFCSPHIGHO2_12_FULL_32_22]
MNKIIFSVLIFVTLNLISSEQNQKRALAKRNFKNGLRLVKELEEFSEQELIDIKEKLQGKKIIKKPEDDEQLAVALLADLCNRRKKITKMDLFLIKTELQELIASN